MYIRKILILASLIFIFTACGSEKVQYTLTCAATCTGGEVIPVQDTACEEAGQNTDTVAQESADKCVTTVENQNCPSPACACQVEETTTSCK